MEEGANGVIKKVWFNVNGTPIHAGEWDYMIRPVEVGQQPVDVDVPDDYALQPGESWVDETPGAKRIRRTEPIYEDRATNPLPEGAYSEEREVVQTADGGWTLAEDYRALRRDAYPPYSPWDVIDEILKHITPEPGSALEQIQAQRLAVKAQYPKPEGDAQ